MEQERHLYVLACPKAEKIQPLLERVNVIHCTVSLRSYNIDIMCIDI